MTTVRVLTLVADECCKITVITLTSTELSAEREADRQKESYLKLPFKCEHCIVGFDHELTVKDHMEKRHTKKKGSFSCSVCQSVLNTDSSFREHCKRHYRRYECSACGKRNNTVHAVIKHYNDQHGGDIQVQFTCQDCGFVAKSDRAYRYHREKHRHQQKLQCSECGNTYVNKTALRVHMLTVHQQSGRTYACALCGKTYSAKSGLLAHTVSAHEPPSGAYCAQCHTHFRTMTNLRTHLKTHSNHIQDHDKRFQCNTCQARFVRKTSLREHIDFIHLNKSEHECSECRKVFKNGASLRKHCTYVHEKKRPPRNKICDHCGRGFTTLAILRSHVRTHTGERPLKCAHCPATFAHSAALYTHNKLLHNGGKASDP
ncbi:zinc finger protein 234-like [Hyposmocoma kahamanoa]|uniref:zinc finger protein 234-like n=1 Tax=Hyposmocoma kahamanoa TaxID=1477025 RepID=UPI000E6D93E5|nr:zinc finger protein 234-like [Hyposmocoma kahamanoa]